MSGEQKAIKYYRIVESKPKPGDTYFSYQAEEISVIDDMVVERTLIDKPNLFEYAAAKMADLTDPRNVQQAVGADFV